MQIERHPVQFFTAVCYDWYKVLESDLTKVIMNSTSMILVFSLIIQRFRIVGQATNDNEGRSSPTKTWD